jgi:hypothetical protein
MARLMVALLLGRLILGIGATWGYVEGDDLIAWTYPCEPDRDNCYDLYPRRFVEEGEKIIAVETYGMAPSERWRAVGAAGERCEFQIHPIHADMLRRRGLPWEAVHNPQVCRDVAFEIWSATQDWRHWPSRFKAGVN